MPANPRIKVMRHTQKAAKVSLDDLCRCVCIEVRELYSNAVLLFVWTHCLNSASGTFRPTIPDGCQV